MNSDTILESEHLIADAIDGAEEILDPLAGLAEKTADDPGTPFMPEALEALVALKRDNRAAFEALRSQLKKAGCRRIKGLFLVAAPEGLRALEAAHPDVEVYVASIDEGLNELGYILPGLGDAGDKIFGTRG